MLSLDPVQVAVVMAAMFFAATVFSTLGFGTGLVALPFLLLALDAQSSVMVITTASLPMVALILLRNWEHLDFRAMLPVALGALGGALTGAYILANANQTVLHVGILSLIILLTLITAFNIRIRIPTPRVSGPVIGYIVAVMTASVGIGTPLILLFFLSLEWPRHKIRVSMAMFYIVMVLAANVGYIGSGLYTLDRGALVLIAAVPVIIGAFLGNRLAYSMNDRVFRIAVIVIIMSTSTIALAREVVTLTAA